MHSFPCAISLAEAPRPGSFFMRPAALAACCLACCNEPWCSLPGFGTAPMRWESVATFDDPIRAQMARNFLDEHGVETMLADQETVATAWPLSNAVGGIKLLVPERDHILAEQLLRSLERGP